MSPEATVIVDEEGADNNASPQRLRTSKLMVSFSMFIAITGLIYNFDLGKST